MEYGKRMSKKHKAPALKVGLQGQQCQYHLASCQEAEIQEPPQTH